MKLNSKQLRVSEPTEKDLQKIKRNDIYIILDNVIDTYNVGAVFRLADAVAAKKVFLCGYTETPPNSRIQKASVGTWQWVEWEYAETAAAAIRNLKLTIQNVHVVSVELTGKSIPYDTFDYPLPVALVVGHETDGVTEEALAESDTVVQLPQLGVNISLNVMVSLGIVLYEALEKNNIR